VQALVRRPSPRLGEGIVTHIPRRRVDAGLALAQWHGYIEALAGAGWEIVELPPADDCPDGVFVEDALVVRGGLAVATRPGAESRRAEVETAAAAAASLGYEVAWIREPGTLDGGDVLETGGGVLVGVGGRTNGEGARQLARLLGVPVVERPVEGVLHLKTALTALPDGSLVEANTVDLGGGRVLVAAGPRDGARVAAHGVGPVAVGIGEFEKLEGGVTCLSVRARRTDRQR
jgi:dimethylargininase